VFYRVGGRGLYICKKTKKKLNADLNAAVNIAHRVGYRVVIKKIESYRVTHKGVKPVTPSRRGRPENPASRDPIVTINAIAPTGSIPS